MPVLVFCVLLAARTIQRYSIVFEIGRCLEWYFPVFWTVDKNIVDGHFHIGFSRLCKSLVSGSGTILRRNGFGQNRT